MTAGRERKAKKKKKKQERAKIGKTGNRLERRDKMPESGSRISDVSNLHCAAGLYRFSGRLCAVPPGVTC